MRPVSTASGSGSAAMVLTGKQFGADELPAPGGRAADYSNTKELGRLIYTEYVYAFELAAVILLVAIVAAIALTLRQRSGSKSMDVAKQVAVKREDRIRIVSMVSGVRLADLRTSVSIHSYGRPRKSAVHFTFRQLPEMLSP